MTQRKWIICDLDGTLYNTEARNHLIANKEYDAFHAASSEDMPNYDVLSLLQNMSEMGFKIVAVTGRNEKFRNITNDWLSLYEAPIECLIMRPDNNYQSDAIVKTNMLLEFSEAACLEKSQFAFALEDRDIMVDAWRGMGIPCYQVRPGGY